MVYRSFKQGVSEGLTGGGVLRPAGVDSEGVLTSSRSRVLVPDLPDSRTEPPNTKTYVPLCVFVEQPSMYEDQGPAVPAWIKVVLVVLLAAVILCAVLSVVCVRQRREIQLLQKGSGGRGEVNQNGIQMNGRITHHPEEQEGLSSPSNHLEHV